MKISWITVQKKLEKSFSPLVFKRSSTGNLSVSVLFLDSMSRTLAFRSLPRTIKFLQKLAKDSKRKVFDFKLFQSIADSTYWHLSNLFDGPKATAQNKFFYIEKSANFFRKFKQEGQSLVFCPFYSKMFYFCYFKQAGKSPSRRPAKRSKEQSLLNMQNFSSGKYPNKDAHKTRKPLFPNWKHQTKTIFESEFFRKVNRALTNEKLFEKMSNIAEKN